MSRAGRRFPVRIDLSYNSLLSVVASILCMSACNRHCVTSCDQPLQAPSGSALSKRSGHGNHELCLKHKSSVRLPARTCSLGQLGRLPVPSKVCGIRETFLRSPERNCSLSMRAWAVLVSSLTSAPWIIACRGA